MLEYQLKAMGEFEQHVAEEKLENITKSGLVVETIGNIKSPIKTGLVLWAHRPPGQGFDISLGLCQLISGRPPKIIVDDVLPPEIFHRTQDEQELVNKEYLYFFKSRGCITIFLSNLYHQTGKNSFAVSFLSFADRISVKDFLHLLPESKESKLSELTYKEAIYMICNLYAFEMASTLAKINTVLIPSFNQATFMLHRKISKKPMLGLVTPTFGDERDISEKLEILNRLTRFTNHKNGN